jgi:hypothetical protein
MISKHSIVLKQYRNAKKMNLINILGDVVRSLEVEILDINKGQMLSGLTGDGKLRFPHTDLYETGDFQDAMFLNVSAKKYMINSSDFKTPELVAWQGKEIFDLNPEHLTIAQDLVEPKFFKVVHEQLNA